jgi:hypothetical protein
VTSPKRSSQRVLGSSEGGVKKVSTGYPQNLI